jgi:predicted nucleic acid-binding protein
MMTMADRAFVDTNVLLRASLRNMPLHQECKALLQNTLRTGRTLWISGQVIREFMVQATHPKTLDLPLTMEETILEVQRFRRLFQTANDTPEVRAHLLQLLAQYPTRGKQVHDANLVATMLAYNIDTLLSLNLTDLQRFQDRITLISPTNINP